MAPRSRRSGKEPATEEREWTATNERDTILLRTCKFEATRFLDTDVLEEMGIHADVLAFLRNAGFGTFPEKRWPLFPEAVAEFLATLELHFPTATDDASDAYITFMLAKRPFTVTLDELCDLYGFPGRELAKFSGVTDASAFWQTFGSGEYVSRGAKQALIRSPVIRLAVRFISSTIFARAETATLQHQELAMCFYGLHPFTLDPSARIRHKTPRVNFAALLCQEFLRVRNNALRSRKKPILIGSMVTPIIAHCGFNIRNPLPENKARFLDREHLYASEILIRHTLVYRYQSSDGVYRYIQLPRTDLTSLAIAENIAFHPPAGALCERPIPPKTSGVRRATRTRRTDEAGPSAPSASTPPAVPHPSLSHLPPFEIDLSAYTATEPPAEPATEMERWVCETTRKNNTLLTRIASWLCCVAPPPPPHAPTPPPSGPAHDDDAADDSTVRGGAIEEHSPAWLSTSTDGDDSEATEQEFRIRTRRTGGVYDTPPSP